jgi:hypothetical protein
VVIYNRIIYSRVNIVLDVGLTVVAEQEALHCELLFGALLRGLVLLPA